MLEGSPFPQGITWIEEEQAYNFALYSKYAESVTLLLYREDDLANPVLAHRLDHLKNKSGRTWHCRIPKAEIKGAQYYGYSISGPKPNGLLECHNFDPQKILLDPYARSVFFPTGFDRNAAM
ncbi:MAG: glycogen-debranching protein, partial [bacterium]|nr:glycogen-debranching protein [bacterium]